MCVCRDLPKIRQETLMQTLEAAANRMKPEQLRRQGAGPPPLITFHRAVPPPSHLQPRLISDPTAPPKGLRDQGLITHTPCPKT